MDSMIDRIAAMLNYFLLPSGAYSYAAVPFENYFIQLWYTLLFVITLLITLS